MRDRRGASVYCASEGPTRHESEGPTRRTCILCARALLTYSICSADEWTASWEFICGRHQSWAARNEWSVMSASPIGAPRHPRHVISAPSSSSSSSSSLPIVVMIIAPSSSSSWPHHRRQRPIIIVSAPSSSSSSSSSEPLRIHLSHNERLVRPILTATAPTDTS